jgi:hypothetical protein
MLVLLYAQEYAAKISSNPSAEIGGIGVLFVVSEHNWRFCGFLLLLATFYLVNKYGEKLTVGR